MLVALDLLLHDDVNKLDQFGQLCVGVIGSLFMGHSEIVYYTALHLYNA